MSAAMIEGVNENDAKAAMKAWAGGLVGGTEIDRADAAPVRGNDVIVPAEGAERVIDAAVAIHDGVRLYALDAHFEEIAARTGLRLYRPGYGGAFEADS